MKFVYTADLHLSRYAQDKVDPQSNLPERLHSIKQALYSMGEYCYNNDINLFIIGGDIMHTKSIIYSIAQEVMIDFFEEFDKLSFIVLDGNHDLSGKGADAISSLRAIDNISGVDWVTEEPYNFDNVVCVPYSYNVVDQVKKSEAQILISHFGLSEALLNSGISIVSQIKLNDLIGKYDLVLLGHYHKPQEITTEDIKLYYVGSPIQLDWGEKGDEKRFLVVDTETLDVQSIPTAGYKKHIELEVNSKNKEEVFRLAEQAQASGDYVKIIKTETVDIQSDQFRIIDKSEKDITNRGVTSTMSDKDKLQKFMEIKEVPSDKQDAFLKRGIEIIDSCEGE
jgi:DNA repair exonuclease SbcCD nuclease subunit